MTSSGGRDSPIGPESDRALRNAPRAGAGACDASLPEARVPRPAPIAAAPTISLIASGDPEQAQVRWWRPIAQAWPAFCGAPSLEVLSIRDSGAEKAPTPGGSAALVIDDGSMPPADVYKLLLRLEDQGVPAVVLVTSGATGHPAARAEQSGSVLVVPGDTDPGVTAATLSALAERQPIVELLRAELGIARRLGGGLRGQIDKIHEELQLAASVQREFLPRTLPADDRVDIQVLFRPTGYVSGDIYDVQRLDEHHLGFFVADAVGHGVPAALMTMVLCRCLVTRSGEGASCRITPPAEVLQRLNLDLIRRHGDVGRFATAVYGIIDCRTREVRLSGAGHPYPLLLRPNSLERITTEGGLLGLFPEDGFPEVSVTLAEDEMLVVYSDGFETAFPGTRADAYGRRKPNANYVLRFQAMADAWRERGLAPSLRRLSEDLDEQAGSLHQVDDLTAMAIVPSSPRALDRLFHGDEQAMNPVPTEHTPSTPKPAAPPRSH